MIRAGEQAYQADTGLSVAVRVCVFDTHTLRVGYRGRLWPSYGPIRAEPDLKIEVATPSIAERLITIEHVTNGMPRKRNENTGLYEQTTNNSDIMDFIRENPKPFVTAKEVIDGVDLGRTRVNQKLNELHESGEIRKTGVGARAVVWWIEPDATEPEPDAVESEPDTTEHERESDGYDEGDLVTFGYRLHYDDPYHQIKVGRITDVQPLEWEENYLEEHGKPETEVGIYDVAIRHVNAGDSMFPENLTSSTRIVGEDIAGYWPKVEPEDVESEYGVNAEPNPLYNEPYVAQCSNCKGVLTRERNSKHIKSIRNGELNCSDCGGTGTWELLQDAKAE